MKSKILILGIALLAIISCSKEDKGINNNLNISVLADNTLYNGVETIARATIDGDIKSMTFYFDGKSVGSMISGPYEVKFTPKDCDPEKQYEIKCIVISGDGIEYSGSKMVNFQLRLGDEFKGGKIFYLDNSKVHGLIAAKEDLHFGNFSNFNWGRYGKLNTTIDNGQANTALISSAAPDDNAYIGYYFKLGVYIDGFNDWFVPSSNELELLKSNKNLVGGFSTSTGTAALYWSSTDVSSTNAVGININALMGNSYDKQTWGLKIRPIRKF